MQYNTKVSSRYCALTLNRSNFATNLKLLCTQHPSVAHVCRSLNINRQQFNKYLNGTVTPSRYNLQRICEFFHVQSSVMDSDPLQFRSARMDKHKTAEPHERDFDLNRIIDNLPNAIDQLERYQGYYYSYFHALGYPGFIVRSLIHIYRHNDRFYTKSVEHLWDKSQPDVPRNRFKYQGIILYLGDRMFLTEYEMLTGQVVCHSIIYPCYRSSIDFLSGITSGVGSLNAHVPKAARVEYTFLGKSIDIKEAIRKCGLHAHDSTSIDSKIRNRISNEVSADEYMLIARGD